MKEVLTTFMSSSHSKELTVFCLYNSVLWRQTDCIKKGSGAAFPSLLGKELFIVGISREIISVWCKASGTVSDAGLFQWVLDAQKEAMERPFLAKNCNNDVKVEEMPVNWHFLKFSERRLKENSSKAFKYCKGGSKY